MPRTFILVLLLLGGCAGSDLEPFPYEDRSGLTVTRATLGSDCASRPINESPKLVACAINLFEDQYEFITDQVIPNVLHVPSIDFVKGKPKRWGMCIGFDQQSCGLIKISYECLGTIGDLACWATLEHEAVHHIGGDHWYTSKYIEKD